MGDGVRKESNDCQGVMNAKLCLSATDKSEAWGRGLRQEGSVVRAHHCHSLAP